MNRKQKMIDYAVGIAKDDSHGYSQVRRWPEEGTDFDCASLMYEAADHAGYKVKRGWPRYTGSMLADFKAAGFTAVPFDGNLSDLEPGDILLNTVNHTEMYIGNGQFVGAHIAETGDVDGKPGDQTGNEISVCDAYIPSFGWDYVLVPPKESGSTAQNTSTASKTTSKSKKRLNGIDISSWQGDIDVSKVDADFVIVKVSGGTSYVNDRAHGAAQDWRDIANKVLKSGKLLGLYHYACEYNRAYTGKSEAKFFLEQIKGFEGKAIMCLDWEGHAKNQPISYAKAFLDAVAKETKSTPMFYAEAGYINDVDCSSIKKYPLWMASYLYRYEYGNGYVDNPDNIYAFGAWDKMTMYQYASTRYIKGYSGRLDVNVFYGSEDDWKKLAGTPVSQSQTQESTSSTSTSKNPVKYRSSNDSNGRRWLNEYEDIQRDGYSGQMGIAMKWLAIDGVERYRVCSKGDKKRGIKGGWLPWVYEYDISDLDKGCAGDGTDIIAIQIDDESVCYAAHITRKKDPKWYADMRGLVDTGGSGDNFAGDLANSIDAFRAKRI